MPDPRPQIRTIERVTLRETVASELRSAIIAGELEPGVVYSAPSLGKRFGVSSTPVREAMQELENEGLVTVVPNKGFRVTEVSEADLDHIAEIRLLIEPQVMRQLAPSITAADTAELRVIAQRCLQAAQEGDLVGYMEADTAFHRRILIHSGNPRLTSLVQDLRAHSRLLGLRALADEGLLARSAQEHLDMVELMETQDAAALERLMRRHIVHVRGIWARRSDEREQATPGDAGA